MTGIVPPTVTIDALFVQIAILRLEALKTGMSLAMNIATLEQTKLLRSKKKS